jgi:endonuclease YncB( thermonuclease family)
LRPKIPSPYLAKGLAIVTLTRLHPGVAALAVVVIFTAALLVAQSVERKPTAPVSPPTAPKVQQQEPSRPQLASALAGIARVVDGDTINIRGTAIRLDAIDAPETKQTCELNGQSYPCGAQATEALITLLGARPVECTETGKDRNGRIIARCRVDATDIGGWMVEHGWAVAYRRFSMAYVGAEERARAAKLGIWAGTFTTPEEWRRSKR